MSSDDLAAARASGDAFLRGDLDGALEMLDPAAEFELPAGAGPEGHTYRGVAGARAAIRRWIGDWDAYDSQIDRYLAAGEDLVVILSRESGIDRSTGAARSRDTGAVITMRSGTAMRIRLFESWPEAVEAAGLDPSEAEAEAPGTGVDPPTGGHGSGSGLWPTG